MRAKGFQFKESVSWSFVTSGTFGVRFYPKGFMFDVSGSSIFTEHDNLIVVCGLLNTKLSNYILNVLNPTLNYQVGNVSSELLKEIQ